MPWPDFFTLLAQLILALFFLAIPASFMAYLVSSSWTSAKRSKSKSDFLS